MKTTNLRAAFALALTASAMTANAIEAVIPVSRDTFITEIAGNTTTPHGTDNYLYLVRGGIGVSGYRTFPLLWFDLSSFAGGVVNGAHGQLKLTLTGSNVVTRLTVLVSKSMVPWSENSVTFANIGSTGFNEATQTGSNLSSTPIIFTAAPQVVSFVVPSTVIQSWIDNPSQNFGLFLTTPATTGSDDKVFSSREGSFNPTLTFDISPVPETASSLLMLGGLIAFGLARLSRTTKPSKEQDNPTRGAA